MTDENQATENEENEDPCGGTGCGFDIPIDALPRKTQTTPTTTTTTTTTTTAVPRLFGDTTPPPPIIEQQKFLGASIVNFSCNGGFGDSVSQLTATVAIDPINSDSWNPNGVRVGEPVFFAFGDIEKFVRNGSFNSATDDLYRVNKPQYGGTIDPYEDSHFSFGGLFQSWDYNKDASSGRLYNVNVVDPREVLAGVQLLLNNYAGSTNQNTNMLNIYGFLEHENEDYKPLWTRKEYISAYYPSGSRSSFTFPQVDFPYLGRNDPKLANNSEGLMNSYFQGRPITGEGMSLRSGSGIPAFRVMQAFNSLMGFHEFPVTIGDQYSQYGGYIKFRGHYYIVDISEVPIPDPYYLLSFDTVNLLELCMELCEASNHELTVSLLPLRSRQNTPLQTYISNFTPQTYRDDGSVSRESEENPGVKISGVIKVTTINRNSSSGQVSSDYIEKLPFFTQSTDIGQELANEVTDKFVTGGKEVNMYYFDSSFDNFPYTRHSMHMLEKSVNKQVIPYYGKLANDTVTLPRGVGPWSQIILDASSVSAAGVGKYYVATELELRAVDISYDKWVEFLQNYNVLFKEKTLAGDIVDGPNNDAEEKDEDIEVQVTVPQCVWPPHPDDLARWELNHGECSPPYGYPLYFGRATAIGLSAGGATGLNPNNPRKGDQPKGDGPQKSPLQKDDQANASRDASKMYDQQIMGFYGKDGLENSKIVYDFLKSIVDECLGKKFLVKIPQKPNTGYGLGVPYGFIPRDANGLPEQQHVVGGGVNQWNNTLRENMLGRILPTTWRNNGALQVGYNFNINEFEFSYTPEPAGGKDPAIVANNGFAQEIPLSPPLLTSFFGGSRTPAYVMYPPAFKEMNVASLDPNTYTIYDIQQEQFASYTTPPPGVEEGGVTTPQSLFVKADLDTEYYFGPITKRVTADVYGQEVEREEEVTEDNKDFIRVSDGTKVVTEFIRPKIYHPVKTSDSSVSLFTIDLEASSNMQGVDYYSTNPAVGGVDIYCLITLPRVAYTEDGNYREGIANKVNLANLTHYLREDVVMGMPGINNAIGELPAEWSVEDFDGGNANEETVKKAVEGLTFSINRRINMASPGPVLPLRVALPLTSHRRTYGPWQSAVSDNGKVEYIQDDSLTPWDYGSYAAMNVMGNLLASRTVDTDLDNERAAFTMVGWPSGLTVAGLLNNGPAITNISLDFSTQGISTTVTMDSYTPSFGKMQKQKADQIKRISRLGQEVKDQRNKLVRNQLINTKSNFSFSKAQKELKEYSDQQKRNASYGSRNSTPVQRGEVENSNIMTFDHQPTKAKLNGTLYDPDAPPEGDFSGSGLAVTNCAMQSAKQLSEMSAIVAQSSFNYTRQYFNSVATSTDEMFIPASYTWHYLLPNIKQPVDRILYIDTIDDDDEVSYYD